MCYRSWLYSDKSISISIYLLGALIVGLYSFTTNYYMIGDTARTYFLVQQIADNGYFATYNSLKQGLYQLQITGLGSLIPPVWIHKILGFDIPVSIKIYHTLLLPMVPMLVYFIARRRLGKSLSLVASISIAGQVCFIQSPSYARFMLAMIPFCLLLLLLLDKARFNWSNTILITTLSALIVLTHYATSIVTILILLGITGVALLLGKYRKLILVAFALAAMLLLTFVWHFSINSSVLTVYNGVFTAVETNNMDLITPPGSDNSSPKELGGFRIDTPDKIIQVAFGSKTPDGDTSIQINPAFFVISWLMVCLSCLGLLRLLLRKELSLFTLSSIVMLIMVLATVAIPYLSRIYGIERTYFQASILLSVCLSSSLNSLNLKIKPELILLPLSIAYFVLSYNFGKIVSIMGG